MSVYDEIMQGLKDALETAKATKRKEQSMNEIERAIEDLRSYADASWGGLNDTFELAISALREKAEREKGCEYCLQGEDLAYGHDSMQRTGRIYLDGKLLTADLYSESMAVAVCYCPMCGKRLEVKQND